LAIQQELVCCIGLTDDIKPESRIVVELLKRKGIQVWMLTGDNTKTATVVAEHVGIQNVMAEVSSSCFLSGISFLL
jgi:Cu+-exporting ATPase